ncbi:nucleoside transporter [Aspergillus luchuensis]|uniref:Nucleoside transporter n=1 Tax=Aspergillus kawachii TaxID=1069201 RepID=A0A146F3M3_ASPKA|nr:nucleoside transporter [Aspergillus luchuensis]
MRDLSLDAGRNYKGNILEFAAAVAGRSNESDLLAIFLDADKVLRTVLKVEDYK